MVKGYKYNQVARNLEGVFVQSITEYFKSLLAYPVASRGLVTKLF